VAIIHVMDFEISSLQLNMDGGCRDTGPKGNYFNADTIEGVTVTACPGMCRFMSCG
jgi:hypothetical protein